MHSPVDCCILLHIWTPGTGFNGLKKKNKIRRSLRGIIEIKGHITILYIKFSKIFLKLFKNGNTIENFDILKKRLYKNT